jgi:hypothetical protein
MARTSAHAPVTGDTAVSSDVAAADAAASGQNRNSMTHMLSSALKNHVDTVWNRTKQERASRE